MSSGRDSGPFMHRVKLLYVAERIIDYGRSTFACSHASPREMDDWSISSIGALRRQRRI